MEDSELAAIRERKLRELQSQPSAEPAADGRPVVLTDATFDEVIGRSGLILVDFWAAWCGPCLRVAPVLEQLAKDRAPALRIGKLNVDENPQTARRFQVMSIPTLLLFKDGKLVDGIVGAVPRPQIDAMIARSA